MIAAYGLEKVVARHGKAVISLALQGQGQSKASGPQTGLFFERRALGMDPLLCILKFYGSLSFLV